MFSTLMLIIEIFFFLSFVNSQRYYAFVETLFVIDTTYFPQPSLITYEEYVQTIVDTTNIIFQSQNDLDVKIEMIVSDIKYLTFIQPQSQEPDLYEPILRSLISDYDKYDSIVLLSYQPWEGPQGAQGYAKLSGVCHPAYKIMYVLPYQNAAFYLAHEFGHQLGLNHQVTTSCYTTSYMSVMTLSHTASYEQARWTTCENHWINTHICEFSCLFNKPDGYRIIKNKYSTLPGKRMSNNQQAKMTQPNAQVMGEVSTFSYRPSTSSNRCLFFSIDTGTGDGAFQTQFTPMLPGSECGDDSICHLDKCVAKKDLDSSLLTIEYVTDFLDLSKHCRANVGDVNELKSSNHDLRKDVQCINWESDYPCDSTTTCPKDDDSSVGGLYIRHICCEKCSPSRSSVLIAFNNARKNLSKFSLLFLFFVCIIVVLNKRYD